jgi:hypothetical protein
MTHTFHAQMNDADICRINRWGVGTRLVGDEGYGPTVMRITGLGEQMVLAVAESHNGVPQRPHEGPWSLRCREWREVGK